MRIFISYGHDGHAPVARRLRDDLLGRGHDVWFDESGIRQGKDWEIAIEEGLTSAEVVIALMTLHAVRRPDGVCLDEISRARFLKKRIIPVMLEWCQPPLCIARLQWIDFSKAGESEERYRQGYGQILTALDDERPCVEGSQARLLEALRPLDFEAQIHQKAQGFVGRAWLLEVIERWITQGRESRTFLVTGEMGSGKTALSAWICQKHPAVAAYHFCEHSHGAKSSGSRCVRSLTYQLAAQLPDFREQLLSLPLDDLETANALTLFDQLIALPSRRTPDPGRPILLVIDSIDEASGGGGNEITEIVAEHFEKTPEWMRLLVTTRPEDGVMSRMARLEAHSIDLKSEQNLADIRSLVMTRLDSRKDDPMFRPLVESVVDRSEGSFLHATVLLEEVLRGRLDSADLDSFPRGLAPVYSAFFQRRFPDIAEFEKTQRPFLELLVTAREGLPAKLIRPLLEWDEYQEARVLSSLGGLLVLEDDAYRFAHRSMKSWITNRDVAGNHLVSAMRGNERAMNVLWKLFHQAPFQHYCVAHLPWHLMEFMRGSSPHQREIARAACRRLLLDPEFVSRKIRLAGVASLLEDLTSAQSLMDELDPGLDDPIATLRRSLSVCAHRVSRDPDRLESLLAQELGPEETLDPALRPLARSLLQRSLRPGSPPWLRRLGRTGTRNRPEITLAGHNAGVTSLEWDPESTSLVSASLDGTTRRWEVASGRSSLELGDTCAPCHIARIDGARGWLATGGKDGILRLWDIAQGRLIREWPGIKSPPTCLAFSPGGFQIAMGTQDGRLVLLACPSLEELAFWKGHTRSVSSIWFAEAGKSVVSTGKDGLVRIWEGEPPRLRSVLENEGGPIHCATATTDGTRVILGGDDGVIRIRRLDGERVTTLDGHQQPVTSLTLAARDRWLVSGSLDKSIRLWDISEGKFLKTVGTHADPVLSVAADPEGRRVASGSLDGMIRIWNTGDSLTRMEGTRAGARILSLACDQHGRILAGSRDGTVRLWDHQGGESSSRSINLPVPVSAVAISRDGTCCLVGGHESIARIWHPADERSPITLEGHTDWIRGVDISKTKERFATSSNDGLVKIWDADGRELAKFDGHTGPVPCVALDPEGRRVASGGNDQRVILHDLMGGRSLSLEGHAAFVTCITWNDDGDTFASGDWKGNVILWDAETGRRVSIAPGSGEAVRHLTFLHGGGHLAALFRNRQLFVWTLPGLGDPATAELQGSGLMCWRSTTGNLIQVADDGDTEAVPRVESFELMIPGKTTA